MTLSNRILAISAGAAILVVVGGAAIAQSAPVAKFIAERGGRLAAALGMNEPQRQEMRELRRSAREQARAIRDDASLTTDQKIAKLDAHRQSVREQALAALTPEQRAAWEAKVAEKKAAKEQRRAAFAKELGLNEAQTTALKGVREEFKTEKRRIWLDSNLTREQMKAQMDQLRSAKENEVKGILTPEQFEKWQAKKAEMKSKFRNRRGGDKAAPSGVSPTAYRA